LNEHFCKFKECGNIEQSKRFERFEMILLESRVDAVIAKRKKPKHFIFASEIAIQQPEYSANIFKADE